MSARSWDVCPNSPKSGNEMFALAVWCIKMFWRKEPGNVEKPLFEELRQTSQDSCVLDHRSARSWDVCPNSPESGKSIFYCLMFDFVFFDFLAKIGRNRVGIGPFGAKKNSRWTAERGENFANAGWEGSHDFWAMFRENLPENSQVSRKWCIHIINIISILSLFGALSSPEGVHRGGIWSCPVHFKIPIGCNVEGRAA